MFLPKKPTRGNAVTVTTTNDSSGHGAPEQEGLVLSRPTQAQDALPVVRGLIEAGRLDDAASLAGASMRDADAPTRIQLQCLKAMAYVAKGDAKSALPAATAAHADALAAHDELGMGEALLMMGFALQSLEEHGRAIDVLTQAERLSNDAGDAGMNARAKRRLGTSLSVLGRHAQAEQLLTAALAQLHEHGPISDAYHAEFSLTNAKSRALDAMPDDEARASLYAQLCLTWRDFAAKMATQGLTRLAAMAMGNAGIAAQRSGDLGLAQSLLEAADRTQQELALVTHLAITQSHLGEVYCAQGKAPQGIAALRRALALLQEERPRDRMEIWEALASAYEDTGELSSALAALKEARALQKQLHDNDALLAAANREQREEVARVINEWSRLADQDALTALPNRRAFDRYVSAIDAASVTTSPVCLILFDLDHFKRINDTLGHAAGDGVLRGFAGVLRRCCRAGDLPVRMGGEEFALLARVQPSLACELAERVRAALAATSWEQLDATLRVTLSAGVASSADFPNQSFDIEHLYGVADRRLYAAKSAGRNRVVWAQ
jgi:diguanylate cyclase (GGDEF)-like protein